MITQRLLISGRVQGVGYRDWMIGEATRLGVSGWVRNVGAAQVEATVQGDANAVAELIQLCYRGPGFARVDAVDVSPAGGIPYSGFTMLPSA